MKRKYFLAALGLAAAVRVASATLMEDLGNAIKDGDVNVKLHLTAGKIPITPAWDLVVVGEPEADIVVSANDGRLSKLHFHIPDNCLILAGRGLRPSIVIEEIDAEGSTGITKALFHGRGFGRLVVGLFKGSAMKAVRKMKFHTDLASLLRGDILIAAEEPAKEPSAAPPLPAAGTPGPSFFDLVRTLEIEKSALTSFGGRHFSFEPVLTFETGRQEGDALKVAIDSLTYAPAHGDSSSSFDMDARFDGRLASGTLAFERNHLSFSRGTLSASHLLLHTGDKSSVAFSAGQLGIDVMAGEFRVPGGVGVALDEGSTFSAKNFALAESGAVSGVLDLDLKGKTGRWRRAGTEIAIESVAIRTHELKVASNRATGDVELESAYRVNYPLKVKYPVAKIPEKTVPLNFEGTLAAHLRLENAGAPDGRISGKYDLRLPWAPVEKGALEVMKARWTQDVTPVLTNVEIEINPSRFGPCGESCFVAEFKVAVDKKSGKTSLFREECIPLGQARLEINKETRAISLRDLKLEPHCKGLTGWVVNLIAPLLTKTYNDVTLLKMPEDFPLSIDEVKTGVNWIVLSGKVDWEAGEETGP